jgi:hypothetical protein
MNQPIIVIKRFAEPTYQDMAPYLTVCQVGDDYYLQLSKNEDDPNWHHHVGNEEQLLKLIEDIRNH